MYRVRLELLTAGLLGTVALSGAGGCLLYDATINQRPSLEIVNRSDEVLYRGDEVRLEALINDPDFHVVTPAWRAYACTDVPVTCDEVPFMSAIVDEMSFVVPTLRAAGEPVRALRIILEATDELGAVARPRQELVLPVANRLPTVQLATSSPYRYLVDTDIAVFAKVGDADDGPGALAALTWEVFGPPLVAYTLADRVVPPDPDDPAHLQVGKTFRAAGAGTWDVRVTATDPQGAATSEMVTITVMPDSAPCLAQLQPVVPPGGAALPLTAPTLFRVPIVIDDLDVYPPVPSDATLGTATFKWSLRAPGASTHAPIPGATSSSVALDPGVYEPGDLLELRVEISDRQAIAIPCPDAETTCSVIAQPSCLQRQTWRVEVR